MGGAHSITALTLALLTSSTYMQLDGYLHNLANTAMQDKTTLVELVAAKVSLTASVATLTTNLANLTAAYSILANSALLPLHYTAIADTGASGHYFMPTAPIVDFNRTGPSIAIGTATGQCRHSSATALLDLPMLPPGQAHHGRIRLTSLFLVTGELRTYCSTLI